MVPKIHIVQERPKKNHELCTCTFEEETTVPSPEFSLRNENIADRDEPNFKSLISKWYNETRPE